MTSRYHSKFVPASRQEPHQVRDKPIVRIICRARLVALYSITITGETVAAYHKTFTVIIMYDKDLFSMCSVRNSKTMFGTF